MVFTNSDGSITSFDFAIDGTFYAIFDSGTAALMIPPMFYKPFIENIFAVASYKYGETIPYESYDWGVLFKCLYAGYFSSITFLI